MQHLSTAELRQKAHEAIRLGDKVQVKKLTDEIKRRISQYGVTPPAKLTTDKEKLAKLMKQREAILKGK